MMVTDYNSLNKIENHESIQIEINTYIENLMRDEIFTDFESRSSQKPR